MIRDEKWREQVHKDKGLRDFIRDHTHVFYEIFTDKLSEKADETLAPLGAPIFLATKNNPHGLMTVEALYGALRSSYLHDNYHEDFHTYLKELLEQASYRTDPDGSLYAYRTGLHGEITEDTIDDAINSYAYAYAKEFTNHYSKLLLGWEGYEPGTYLTAHPLVSKYGNSTSAVVSALKLATYKPEEKEQLKATVSRVGRFSVKVSP